MGMTPLIDNLHDVQAKLPSHVTLVAVSKTKPIEDIETLYQAGQRDFGENRVQEMAKKAAVLPSDIHWHMIGHIQSNKVKDFASFVHMVHSVDRNKVANALNKAAAKNERNINVLLQMHIATESSKQGYELEELQAFQPEDYPHLTICGLMGMATFTDDKSQISTEFQCLQSAFDGLKERFSPAFKQISMGMSGDFQLAIEKGSTMVRVGSSIFGQRS